MFIVSDGSVA